MAEAPEGTLFKAEYEHELERWLRRRYSLFLGCTIAWNLLLLLFYSLAVLYWRVDPEQVKAGPGLSISLVSTILVLAVAARAFIVVCTKLETREQTLRSASWFILQIGAVNLTADATVSLLDVLALPEGIRILGSLSGLFALHFLACLFLPWTPRESMRPMYPLLGLYIVLLVVLLALGRLEAGQVVGLVLSSPFILMPGCFWCWMRLRRRRKQFNREMVTKGFFSMRRELNQARAVQLALFPKPIRQPGMEFDFAYVPANEVGGDFIHASIDEKGRLDIVVLDVTGHGLASALTVSRLSGEIERLLAEDPDIEPGHVLRLLNRYVNLTLSRHNVYATALCIQVFPDTGEVQYANAGHPPAFVRRANGTVERFDSTTWLLGAAPDSMFEEDQLVFTLGPQDTLVLVTDGVHEAPDRKGQRFGLDRLQEAFSRTPAPERWCQHIASVADNWRKGLGDDDLLVASIRVPLAAPAPPKARPRAADIDADTGLGMGMTPFAAREGRKPAAGGHLEAAPLRAPDSGQQA